MPDRTTGAGTNVDDDPIALLTAQHREFAALFDRLERGDGDDAAGDFDRLRSLLAVHETAEEEVVYPALRRSADDGDGIARARIDEEDDAKRALKQLEDMGVDDPGFLTNMTALRMAVLDHAANEERTVFPALRANVDHDHLERMATMLRAAESVAPTHPHPMGPNSATGNLVVGPFAAVADRVRDAIRDMS